MVLHLVLIAIENQLLNHVTMLNKEYLVQNYNLMVIVVLLLFEL
jgi:hypothetical protein